MEAVAKLKEGVIGRVYMARGLAYKSRPSTGKMTVDPIPAGLNWDTWLGPAPKVMGRDQVKHEPVRLIEDVDFDLRVLALKAPLRSPGW